MKSLNHYFPEFGTGCVAKVARMENDNIVMDTLVEGYAQIKPYPIEMEEDSLFDIASLTKTITAILVHKAVERNLFTLNSHICFYDCLMHLDQKHYIIPISSVINITTKK